MPTLETNINKRFAKMFGMQDQIIDKINGQYDKLLISLYKTRLLDIQKELSSFIGKLDNVTIQEARKYKRLINFEKLLQDELNEMGVITKQITRKAIQENFTTGYYSTHWVVENSININMNIAGLDTKAIRAALINPMDAIGWPNRTTDNINVLINRTRQAVTEGLTQGTGYQKTAALFKDKMEKSLYEAQRIIHTETQRARTTGFNDGFDNSKDIASSAGVEIEKIWDATLDKNTRPSHQAIDQKAADNDGFWTFPDGIKTQGPAMSGVAAEDINCRCVERIQVIGMEPDYRKDNESKDLVEIVDYSDWMKNKGLS